MKYLRSLVGVSRIDRVRNEGVRRRAGIQRELASRADQRVLIWFGHVERMDWYRMARRVLMSEVSGGRVRGRPRLGWMDGVKVALGNKGTTVERSERSMRERSERVERPGTYVTDWISRRHFCLALCSFGPPSRALVVITWRWLGCLYVMRLKLTLKRAQVSSIWAKAVVSNLFVTMAPFKKNQILEPPHHFFS